MASKIAPPPQSQTHTYKMQYKGAEFRWMLSGLLELGFDSGSAELE